MLAMFLSGLIIAALAHAAGPQPPAVPVDPREVAAIIEIPAGGEVKYERDSEGRIVAFFQVYKQDADGKTPVALSGIGGAREADLLLRAAQVRASGQ